MAAGMAASGLFSIHPRSGGEFLESNPAFAIQRAIRTRRRRAVPTAGCSAIGCKAPWLLALGLLGCGTRNDPSAAFIGTWTGKLATEGQCLDGSTISQSTFPVQASITKGTATDLVSTTQTGMACVIPLNLQDSVATLVPLGDGCATADGKPLRLKSWSVNLLREDLIAESGGGSIDAPAAGGSCTVIFHGTLTR